MMSMHESWPGEGAHDHARLEESRDPVRWTGVPVKPDTLPWPSAREADALVRTEVAREWDVEPDRIRLVWGPVRSGEPPAPDASVTLLGSGEEGHWVAAFEEDRTGRSVQVRLRAGIAVLRPVAARRLSRGHVLKEGDILWEGGLNWGPERSAQSDVASTGWVTRRVIRAGEVLVPPAVDRPILVDTGDDVEILWSRNAVSVNLRGRALGSGMEGETINVRTEAGTRLRAVVRDQGVVVVGPSNREAA